MKTTTIISLFLSLLLGVGAILLGRGYLSTQTSEAASAAIEQRPAIKMTDVLVVAEEIKAGELIDPKKFKTVQWPEKSVPEGSIKTVNGLGEKIYARTMMLPGEPVMGAKLDASGATLTLAASVTPGMRAVSVEVQKDTGVAGWVLPGDRVDVNEFIPIDTLGDQPRRANEEAVSADLVARPVVKNVKVLAVDQSFESGMEGAVPSDTVTLEVTPEDALKVGLASQRAAIGLALIGREEASHPLPEAPKKPAKQPAKAAARAPTAETPANTTVRVINGIEETTVNAPKAQTAPASEGVR